MTESFYDLLGVPADANADEIKRAYRERIKETHPDRNDDPNASAETARLVEARDVLVDDEERARYDRLGHDAYVGGEFGASGGQAGPGSTQAAAEAERSDSGSAGPTNARPGPEERRRRERRAREDVDFDGEERRSARNSGGHATASNGGTTATGGATTASTGRSTATAGGRAASATNKPPSWNRTTDGWAARSPADPPPGLTVHTITAVREAPATAIVTFLLYPLLVLGAFLPAFPLGVNLIVGACLLTMIAAAQSVAGLGVAIYGAWSLLGTVGLIAIGTHPFSPLGLVVLGSTWLPLGFSVLTYEVLDS